LGMVYLLACNCFSVKDTDQNTGANYLPCNCFRIPVVIGTTLFFHILNSII